MARCAPRIFVFCHFPSANIRISTPATSFLVYRPLRPTWRALSTFPGHGQRVPSILRRSYPRDDERGRLLHWQKRHQSSSRPEEPSTTTPEPESAPIEEDPIPRRLTLTLISLCAAGWAAHTYGLIEARSHQNTGPLNFVQDHLIATRQNWDEGRWWTALTYAFCHNDIFHVGFNCYVLWSFGPAVIQAFGPQVFLSTWVLSSITCYSASIYFREHAGRPPPAIALRDGHGRGGTEKSESQEPLWKSVDNRSTEQDAGRPKVPHPRVYGGAMGSSGAILGEIALFGFAFPSMPISLFFIPIGIPIWAVGGAFVAFESWCIFRQKLRSTGHIGHLGGVAGGAAAYYTMIRPWLRRVRGG